MAQMPREPEAFGEQVAKILHRHFPDRQVELAGPLDLVLNGKHLGLENLYLSLVPRTYEPTPLAPLDYGDNTYPGEDAAELTPYGPAGEDEGAQ